MDELIKRLKDGCINHKKRWSGDNHMDLGGSVDEISTDAIMKEAAEALEKMHSKPSPPLLTDDEIYKEHCKVKMSFDWDRGFESGARWAEEKVRIRYEK